MNLLGDTLDKIAFEKAGIIKAGVPVVISEKQENISYVFSNKANETNASLFFADDYVTVNLKNRSNFIQKIDITTHQLNTELEIDLPGTYQLNNIKGVIKTILILQEKGWKIDLPAIKNGIRNVKKLTGLMGRWQVLGEKPLIICDTGHNKEGVLQVLENIKLTPYRQLHFVLGMVNDKDISGVLNLLPKNAYYYFCKPNIPRGLESDELMKQAIGIGLNGEDCKDVESAVKTAKSNASKDDLIFIGGSTFVVADAL
jgi:dihydrofolate synthase/folylpolyglutamate synthase